MNIYEKEKPINNLPKILRDIEASSGVQQVDIYYARC
jgi:hypothetical protein